MPVAALPLQLRVVHPRGTRTLHDVSTFPVRFGREEGNTIVLNDVSVSRRHAELYESGDRLFVRDLKSLNGVRLNGVVTIDAEVLPGDILTIGIYEVHIVDPRRRENNTPMPRAAELPMKADGVEGVLEIIRAIDVDKVLKREAGEEVWTGNLTSEDMEAHYSRLHQAYSHLLVMMNLVSSVGNYSHSHQITAQFVSTLRKVFPLVENVAVVEIDDESQDGLRVTYQERLKEGQTGLSNPSRTVLKRVLKEMRAIYAVDARRDPRFENADSLQQRGVRSMMCAPLVARGQVVGAIYVENLTQAFCFSYFDLNLLTVFSFHLAVAIETSRLLEERDKAFEKAAKSIKAAKQDKVALILQYSQSEKKFRALFEQSALGAAVINLLTGRIEEVNDGLVRMLGYTRRHFVDMEFETVFPKEGRRSARNWLTHVRENGEGSCKCELQTSDGKSLVALQSCRALRLGDSEVMVAYFIDITAKERAEQETRTQLQRVTALSELSQTLMTTMNAEAIHNLLFRQVRAVLPISRFVVAELDPDTTRLSPVFAAQLNPPDQWTTSQSAPEFDPGDLHVQKVLHTKEASLYLPETDESTARIRPGEGSLDAAGGGLILVPLASRNQLIGVVVAESTGNELFDRSHLETLRAMVAQAALALSNAHAFEAIRKQEENLRQLSLQIMTAQETERGRISRELHDGVGQQLTAMKYILEGIRNAARSKDEEKLQNRIAEARELATQIIQDLRAISLDLRPTMLDDLGLQPTLEWFVRQYSERYGIDVDLTCEVDESLIPPPVSTAVYRIIQEAFGNAAKHSSAKRVQLLVRTEDQALCAEIADDGIGFDPNELPNAQKTRGCSGMLNMKERAHFLGGEFTLETAPGRGTKLSLAIPMKETPS